MGRRQTDTEIGRFVLLVLLLLGSVSCLMVYLCFSMAYNSVSSSSDDGVVVGNNNNSRDEVSECCRGIEHLELWGDAVKWGSDFKVDSSEKCCMACKDMCGGGGGGRSGDEPCLCDSWVFCGDKQACGSRFGECWLKKQKDTLDPAKLDSGDHVMWTSGVIFGKREGIVGLETEYGVLRVKLLPDCAPLSVSYILELLAQRHCAGCQFYRAESRGHNWDPEGNHIKNASFGPPYALIQGTLETHGTVFKDIPTESCPTVKRGAVAWVGSGPEFFISLANHLEWPKTHTVFGFVLPQDMENLERIARLATKPDVWSSINVSVLEKPVHLRFRRINTSH
ncbi:hypothetical protein Q3G72_035220 [Acer saccharum]|nr:hypothetical protein Q3G72_035220 [Acer saccharum]